MKPSPAVVVCVLLCLQAAHALAQDVEAISRAQRDASNPLRMIIEASKLKRPKAGETEAAPAPAPKAAVQAARPAPARPAAGAAQAEPPLTAQAEPAQPLQALPLPVVETSAPAPQPALALALPSPAPTPAAAPAPPVAPQAAPPVAPQAAPRAVLKLADYVEPVLPDRVRRRLQGDGEVVLSFIVNADGTVADLAVRTSSERALDAIALDAVRQWRYEPIAAAQPHGVQLVFKLRE